MKLSEFTYKLKSNLSNWEIDIDDKTARLTLKDRWCEENEITYADINYIKDIFNLNHVIIKNSAVEWECNNIGIISTINFNHNFKFEKEEWKLEIEQYDRTINNTY